MELYILFHFVNKVDLKIFTPNKSNYFKITYKNILENYIKENLHNLTMLLKNLKTKLNEEVNVNGWVLTMRQQKDYSFIKLTDGSNSEGLQLVIDNSKIIVDNIYTGTSLNVKGLLIESPMKGQLYELQVNELIILGKVNPEEYPLAKGKLPLVYLRNYPHLRMRTNTYGAVFRIKSAISFATHLFYKEENYLHLDPNILTINECEGGAGVFQVTEKDITDLSKLEINKETKKYDWLTDHFDKPVYLTVSSQLQLEAISCALGAVYTTNKSFRSEHSSTNKHLSEFSHLEIENTFIDLNDLMDIGEKYIKFVGNYILKNNEEDLKCLDNFVSKGIIDKIKSIINSKFIRLDYGDAVEIINKSDNIKISYNEDLSSECENYLTEYFGNNPVFVKNWPISIKSFYMKQNDDGITCSNFDLLMPHKVGELIGGSMREENLDKILNMMKIKGVDPRPLDFYLDLRKYGTVPHGGFGLGLDRMCMLFTGMESIKDVVPFPVYYKNCSC
jgi:asparaginyl-tRNA synthetase